MCFHAFPLFHDIIEARLASQTLSVVTDVQCYGAAVVAFEIAKLVTMDLAHFFPVPEFDLSALLAHEILQFLVFSQRTIVVVHTTQVDLAALAAVVKSRLVEHELHWLLKICVTLGGHAAPFVQAFHAAQSFDHLLYFCSLGFLCLKEVLNEGDVLVRF